MRLRNLFMILLLCMTVGVLGTSCTGDDGAPGTQGERGEQGEQGEQGEKGDPGDPSDMEATYSFLATWGAEDGKVTCDHDIFTGMAAFPQPEELKAISTAADGGEGNLLNTNDLNNPFAAVCSGSLFHDSAVVKADDYLTVVAADAVAVTAGTTEDGRLLFVKTGRTDLDPEVTSPKPNADDIGPAIRMTVTKNFVGGYVFADLNNTGGTSEPLQRQLLYSGCNIAEDPAKIKGMWQGVKVVQTKRGFRDGERVDLIPFEADGITADTDADDLVVTTRKVCVRLDTLPGTVKCFIDVVSTDPMVKTSKTISLYDAGTATTVKKLNDADAPAGTLSGDVANATAATLFTADDLTTNDVEQLCNLFGEGL